MDLMMETERLKAIEKFEEREALRRMERMRGGQVIKEQLAEREAERARQREIKEQEGVMLKKELERLKVRRGGGRRTAEQHGAAMPWACGSAKRALLLPAHWRGGFKCLLLTAIKLQPVLRTASGLHALRTNVLLPALCLAPAHTSQATVA